MLGLVTVAITKKSFLWFLSHFKRFIDQLVLCFLLTDVYMKGQQLRWSDW